MADDLYNIANLENFVLIAHIERGAKMGKNVQKTVVVFMIALLVFSFSLQGRVWAAKLDAVCVEGEIGVKTEVGDEAIVGEGMWAPNVEAGKAPEVEPAPMDKLRAVTAELGEMNEKVQKFQTVDIKELVDQAVEREKQRLS